MVLNPKNLIGIDEFNQDFFNEIDKIENKISQNESFSSIIENIKTDVKNINEFAPDENKSTNED